MTEYQAPREWHIETRFGRFYVVNQWGGFAMHWPTIEQAQSQLAEYVRQGDTEAAEPIRCQICHEPVIQIPPGPRTWAHWGKSRPDNDIYCWTGDGAMAIPDLPGYTIGGTRD